MQEASTCPCSSNLLTEAGARTITSSLSSQLKASNSLGNTSLNDKRTSLSTNNSMTRRDNSHIPSASQLQTPFTPRRMGFPGPLSLKMPSRGPLSPVLDPALGYSVARRPRLDFARACMNISGVTNMWELRLTQRFGFAFRYVTTPLHSSGTTVTGFFAIYINEFPNTSQ